MKCLPVSFRWKKCRGCLLLSDCSSSQSCAVSTCVLSTGAMSVMFPLLVGAAKRVSIYAAARRSSAVSVSFSYVRQTSWIFQSSLRASSRMSNWASECGSSVASIFVPQIEQIWRKSFSIWWSFESLVELGFSSRIYCCVWSAHFHGHDSDLSCLFQVEPQIKY